MKRILLALALLPSLCLGAAFDFGIDQRSAANNSWEKRLLISPATTGIMAYDPSTKLASWVTLGQGLSLANGVLSSGSGASVAWDSITGKPTFSTVATTGSYTDLSGKPVLFSGAYADLTGKPSIPPAQVPSDWNATTGVSAILNKPTLFSGAYSDLTGLPSLFSGAYSDLTGKPVLFSGSYTDLSNKPSIPAAQVPVDWAASSGVSAILNKPSLFSGAYADLIGKPVLFSGSYADLSNKPIIPAAQVQTDWNATSGMGVLLNKPNLFSGVYADLTGKPNIPAPQINADWNSSTGLSQVLNKPSSFPPSAHTQPFSTITNTPTTMAGYGITDGINTPTPASATRALNTAFQVSVSRPVLVSYSVDISVVSLLLTGTQGTITLQYADTAAMTSPVTVSVATNSTGGVLNVANIGTASLVGFVPAGKFVRLTTTNVSGTPTFTFRNGQETIF